MKYSTEFLQKARFELIEAWKWYEDRQLGLGDKFKLQVDNCIRIIEQNPERYPEQKRNYREGIVKIFPYLIIYRVNKRRKIIAVISVFHTSRNPHKKYHK